MFKFVKKSCYVVKQAWHDTCDHLKKVAEKVTNKLIGGAAIATGTAVSTSASAALDPSVATTFTTIQSDFTSMMGLVWPVIGAVFAALAIIGLVRAALQRGGIRA